MSDRGSHITRQDLEDLLSGQLSMLQFLEGLLAHVRVLCPSCRDELSSFLTDKLAAEKASAASEERVFTNIRARASAYQVAIDQERAEAAADFTALQKLPASGRLRRVRSAQTHFRSLPLVTLCLESSRTSAYNDPAEALSWAEVAREVCLSTPFPKKEKDPLFWDAMTRVHAHTANAHRVAARLREAQSSLELAFNTLEATPDPLTHAETFSFAASLHIDLRDFAVAERFLDHAAELYKELHEPAHLSKTLLKQARLHYLAGESDRAIPLLGKAQSLISQSEDPRLAFCLHQNLAVYLYDLGRYPAAFAAQKRADALAKTHPRFASPLHCRWSRAAISGALGNREAAIAELTSVRTAFLEAQQLYPAAIVTLDLAGLYAQGGDFVSVRRLAQESAAAFTSLQIDREAIAALTLFCQAAARDELETAAIRKMASLLRRNSQLPPLRKDEDPS